MMAYPSLNMQVPTSMAAAYKSPAYNFSGMDPNVFGGSQLNDVSLGNYLQGSNNNSGMYMRGQVDPNSMYNSIMGNSSATASPSGMNINIDPNSFANETLNAPTLPDTGMAMTDKLKLGIGGAVGAFGAYNAYQTNKIAKSNLNFQKEAFNKNYAAQKGQTNAAMEDRQRRLNLQQPNAGHLSVADYMDKFGVK